MKRTWLVLSPHFDDAVLSIPLWMSQQVDKGDRVVVATLFSAGDPDDPGEMKIRQAEDKQAMALLACESVHLGFTDAPYRNPPRTSFMPIVFGAIESDESLITPLKRAIENLLAHYPDTRIIAPLAVGTHIDHRLTFLASVNHACYFYEDRPYALIRGAVTHRLAQLGARAPLDKKEMTGFVKDYLHAGYVQTFLDTREIPHAKRLLLLHNKSYDVSLNLRPLSVEASNSEQTTTAGKAIMAYTSQLDDLFPNGLDTFWTRETLWEKVK